MIAASGWAGWRWAGFLAPAAAGSPLIVVVVVTGTSSLLAVSVLTGLPGLFTFPALFGGLLVAGLLAPRRPVGGNDAVSSGPPLDGSPTRWEGALAAATVALAATAALASSLRVLRTGMTGFDSTWYHGPIAAEFARTGETFALHVVSPQFLTWFYPHNSELLNGVLFLAWGGDLPALFLNLAVFAGCLVAAWALARPFGGSAGPVSVAGVALVAGLLPAFADQFGEARNDLAGTLFLIAGSAVLLNGSARIAGARLPFLVGLAAGLAAGTKLNFVPAALVLAVGTVVMAERGRRWSAVAGAGGGLLVTGGFWYLRNLVQSGNPLPWTAGDGPFGIVLPGPVQETGGREAGSVLGYLTDPSVVWDWFLPGLAEGFGSLWPLVLVAVAAGFVLALLPGSDGRRRTVALAGLAVIVAWAAGPTSASGPPGEPVGYLSGLRYLVPGLVIGAALLGPGLAGRDRRFVLGSLVLFLLSGVLAFAGRWSSGWEWPTAFACVLLIAGLAWVLLHRPRPRPLWLAVGALALAFITVAGFEAASRFDRDRYLSPEFTAPGLNRAFAYFREGGDGPIGTTATRSYPLRGADLSTEVGSIGVPSDSGGFERARECATFLRLVERGGYRYLVLSLDRIGEKRSFPPEAAWVARSPGFRQVFRQPPTVVFEVTGRPDPGACR